ncbi:MAG: glycosyltransferase [Oscillospiraceae bacterium]|nr:glycosyltransferase [Oscillospiraceae bacterium]
MDKIAVLIPCYNEALTIQKVISDFRNALPDAAIYVYDNNSTDETYQLAEASGAVVRREPKQGKGNVLRTMFREIDAECYLLVDGDDTYPSESARALCDAVLLDRCDMSVGDRLSSTYFTENKRPFHNFGNVLVRFLVNHLFKGNIVDIMTGYRALSYNFVKSFPLVSSGFEIETEMTIHALDKNLNTVNIPVTYRDRPEGSTSKLNTVSDGLKVLRMVVKLFRDYKPLAFFGVVAAVLVVIALALILPILGEFYQTGVVMRFPTLFMAGFIGLSGLLALVCGMILDSIAAKERREFEFKLQQIEYQKKQILAAERSAK